MLSDDEIDKLYEIDDYIEAAEKADVLFIERYDIWQMDRVSLKAFAKLVEERTAAKERKEMAEHCLEITRMAVGKAVDSAIKKEREACANVCVDVTWTGPWKSAAIALSNLIRARGEA